MPPGPSRANTPASAQDEKISLTERYLGVFKYSGHAIKLVWATSWKLTTLIGLLTIISGILPAAVAFVGKLIVDQVLLAAESGLANDRILAFWYVALEAGLVVLIAGSQKGLTVCQSLLRALLGHKVNVLILEKALTLSLVQFEDSEFYDKLTRARREASSRPLSLVNRTFALVQNGITLTGAAVLLWQFSPWAVLLLVMAGLPVFLMETRYSGEAFRLFRWRSPEARRQRYLETVLAREDYAKEVKLFGLGPLFLDRYKEIFTLVFGEDRNLTLRRGFWGFVLGLVSTAAFYGAYIWVVVDTVATNITLGDMTMYLLLFKQGQSAVSASLNSVGGMYEDNLYLSTLYELLDEPVIERSSGVDLGQTPGDGLRFEDVWFSYPGQEDFAVKGVSLHLPPGQKLALVGENGSGKTTLIKLMTRLYTPSKGRILLDGTDLRDWSLRRLHERIGVIFQDFVRYQLKVGENIGVGDVQNVDDEDQWAHAGQLGMASPFIEEMPEGYHTQLGRWFRDGRELSGGQWQKIALSRAFMRKGSDILVFDEPTSAMDANAESEVFDRIRALTTDQIAILISHRFSTVRMADRIAVLQGGAVHELGTHEELLELDGVYAYLFNLQAEGYR